jgi:hypothetical protein
MSSCRKLHSPPPDSLFESEYESDSGSESEIKSQTQAKASRSKHEYILFDQFKNIEAAKVRLKKPIMGYLWKYHDEVPLKKGKRLRSRCKKRNSARCGCLLYIQENVVGASIYIDKISLSG